MNQFNQKFSLKQFIVLLVFILLPLIFACWFVLNPYEWKNLSFWQKGLIIILALIYGTFANIVTKWSSGTYDLANSTGIFINPIDSAKKITDSNARFLFTSLIHVLCAIVLFLFVFVSDISKPFIQILFGLIILLTVVLIPTGYLYIIKRLLAELRKK